MMMMADNNIVTVDRNTFFWTLEKTTWTRRRRRGVDVTHATRLYYCLLLLYTCTRKCVYNNSSAACTRVFIVFDAKALTRWFCNRLLHPLLQTGGGGPPPSSPRAPLPDTIFPCAHYCTRTYSQCIYIYIYIIFVMIL